MSFTLEEMETAVKSIKFYERLLFNLELHFSKGIDISFHGIHENHFLCEEIFLSSEFKEDIIVLIKDIIDRLKKKYDIKD